MQSFDLNLATSSKYYKNKSCHSVQSIPSDRHNPALGSCQPHTVKDKVGRLPGSSCHDFTFALGQQTFELITQQMSHDTVCCVCIHTYVVLKSNTKVHNAKEETQVCWKWQLKLSEENVHVKIKHILYRWTWVFFFFYFFLTIYSGIMCLVKSDFLFFMSHNLILNVSCRL